VPPSTPIVPSLVFLPGLARAETPHEQLVPQSPAQIAHIEIHLETRDDYPRFRVELSHGGEQVLTRGNLRRSRTGGIDAVSLDLPASALAAGDYELALRGLARDGTLTDIGYYYFSVRKY
jgi:hypothetical protein